MNTSQILFDEANMYIPGGVNSPVRSFSHLAPYPLFISCAEGAYVYDVDDKPYIDYVGSWGPMILGHNNKKIKDAVIASVNKGLSFGAPIENEVLLAKLICDLIPSVDKIRMVNSGTEATMSAIRLARGFTGKNKIIKFEGCYHGHSDGLLVQAGSGALTLGSPSSAGVPKSVVQDTIVCGYNDVDTLKDIFLHYKNDIAGVIVEPIAGNMNCILPNDNFLFCLRELCDQYQSVLIFDEVMTGFRAGKWTVQQKYRITPDLTCFGKIIGGGMPVGAFGGKKVIMDCLAPVGDVYQAGTLSGNPIAMSAGIACITELTDVKNDYYDFLEKQMFYFVDNIKILAKKHHISLLIHYSGAMFGLMFTDKKKIDNFKSVSRVDLERFKYFFNAMLEQGVYMAPSAFEAGFISIAHNKVTIDETLNKIDRVFFQMTKK